MARRRSKKLLSNIAALSMAFTVTFTNVTTANVLANEELPQVNSLTNNQNVGEDLFEQNLQVTTGQAITLSFDNLDNENVFGKKVVEITGQVSEKPKSFKINEVEVNLGVEDNELAFKHSIALESGLNKVNVQIIDDSDKIIEEQFNVYCDVTAPVITLTNLIVEGNNTIIEIDENVTSFRIEGTVEDDLFGYELSINGEIVLPLQNKEIGQENKRSFSYEVPVVEDITDIILVAQDSYIQNTTSQAITLMKPGADENKPFKIEDLTGDKTFHNGEQAQVDVKVTNISEIDQNITLAIGIFDENEVMIHVNAATQKVVKDGEVVLTGILSIPEEGNYKLRAFVWDSLQDMNSLSDSIEYIVQP